MTKEKIIDTLLNSGKISDNQLKFDLFTGDIANVAGTLLALIEQEKKEVAKEILNDIFSDVCAGDLGEFLGWGWIYDIDEAKAIAKEYGVEL